jgi:hypothetical protein
MTYDAAGRLKTIPGLIIDRLIRLLLFVGLFLGATSADAMADRAPELPVRVINVTMAKAAMGTFLEQLRKFADANE